ncbi:TolC family protein, partial [bacterium]|nr:TolC family protein [bacterium]
ELAVITQSAELYKKSPVFDLYTLEELPGIEESVIGLKKQSRLLQTFDILKEQLVCSRDGLIEQKRPQLNLSLSGSLNGSDEEIGKSLELSKPDASVSLEFSTPLGNRGIKSGIEKADLQIKKLQEEKRDIEITLEATLRNLLIRIVDMESILKLNQAQIESAQEKTEEELKMYNQGRGQLTFVIQSRDNEQNARLGYAGNAALYHTLLLQYHALLDELFHGK